MTPLNPVWYLNYVSHPKPEVKKWAALFRRRFCMPYESFLELVDMVKDSNLFDRWKKTDCCGKPSSPIEVLILGALRYIGRGWTFDDLFKSTRISEEVHRQFLHVFIFWGSTVLYSQFVVSPTNAQEIVTHMKEYTIAGLNGCFGSMDATHISMEMCYSGLKNFHSGGKLKAPSRTYNIIVNHRRRIIDSTHGHPARWNDKTLILYHDFACDLHNSKILQDVEFDLLEKDGDGVVHSQKYKGAWMIVDNGYLAWPSNIPPFSDPIHIWEHAFTEWIESVRKDVECTFGIMKGRFRQLKTGTRIHGHVSTDRIWLTCCALHNMLLEVDGLDNDWESGVPSDWEGELGHHNTNDVLAHIPTDIRNRMNRDGENINTLDYSRIGRGSDECDDNDDSVTDFSGIIPDGNDSSVRVVNQLNRDYFRERLVENFHIRSQNNDVSWPRSINNVS